MTLILKGTTNGMYQYIKDITFKLKDESIVKLKRTRTVYTIDGKYFDMAWHGVHTVGYKGNDYTVPARAFNGAEIIDISLTEDAPKGYEFFIDSWTARDS